MFVGIVAFLGSMMPLRIGQSLHFKFSITVGSPGWSSCAACSNEIPKHLWHAQKCARVTAAIACTCMCTKSSFLCLTWSLQCAVRDPNLLYCKSPTYHVIHFINALWMLGKGFSWKVCKCRVLAQTTVQTTCKCTTLHLHTFQENPFPSIHKELMKCVTR